MGLPSNGAETILEWRLPWAGVGPNSVSQQEPPGGQTSFKVSGVFYIGQSMGPWIGSRRLGKDVSLIMSRRRRMTESRCLCLLYFRA